MGRYSLAYLVSTAGILLLVVIYPRHPLTDWLSIWKDPQQCQHTLMALAITVAGIAELAGWRFVWSAVTILFGAMFLVHTQHGQSEAVSQAVIIHRALGITLILAGVLNFADRIFGINVFVMHWPVL